MNFVSLIGTIENHPTEVETNKGQKHARFRLITSNTIVTAQGTPKTRRETHDVFAWGKWHQVICTYGQPNLHVAIEGRLVNRYYLNQRGSGCGAHEFGNQSPLYIAS